MANWTRGILNGGHSPKLIVLAQISDLSLLKLAQSNLSLPLDPLECGLVLSSVRLVELESSFWSPGGSNIAKVQAPSIRFSG